MVSRHTASFTRLGLVIGGAYVNQGKTYEQPAVKGFLNPETLGQFMRYFIVGIVGFALEYTLFIVLRNSWRINELLVNIMVYTVIFWFNFLLNKFYSFKSEAISKAAFLLRYPVCVQSGSGQCASVFRHTVSPGTGFWRRIMAGTVSSQDPHHVLHRFLELHPVQEGYL